jgi:hypothetical protein
MKYREEVGRLCCPAASLRANRAPASPRRLVDGWLDETAYRLMIWRNGTSVRLYTRNGHDWADRFPTVLEPNHVATVPRLLRNIQWACAVLSVIGAVIPFVSWAAAAIA